MKKRLTALLFALGTGLPVLLGQGTASSDALNLIPKPVSVKTTAGETFRLTGKTTISCDAALRGQAELLRERLEDATGLDIAITDKPRRGGIRLTVDSSAVVRAEGYRLTVGTRGVTVCGHDAAGVFYGTQTLLQLFPAAIHDRTRQRGIVWEAPAAVIDDAPSKPWRGMMLDLARYYYDKEYLLKFIDMMAAYKLNKLQLHLTDDSGWRIEIKKYPRLTEVGAWAGHDEKRRGGFYTQEELREVVRYAALRGVEVIPEIELPAHMLSAIAAYPWLCCTGEQHEVQTQHFISPDILCVGNDDALRFIRDVLDETIDLFPSRYINIGGDEAVYKRWNECPKCRKVMEREGLADAGRLQGWLTNVVAGWMKEKGRTIVGWEEIFMRGEVKEPLVALIWHNVADTLKAKEAGQQAILVPATHTYFDFPETRQAGEPQAATWMPPITLEKAYSMPAEDYSKGGTTLGVQGCIWSDQFITGTALQDIPHLNEHRSERYVEYLLFPRMTALSEVAWSRSAERDFADFRRRLGHHYARFDHAGINFRVPEPVISAARTNSDGSRTFTLETVIPGADIRYTTDGTLPNSRSPRYTAPVTVKNPADFRAVTVLSRNRTSLPVAGTAE